MLVIRATLIVSTFALASCNTTQEAFTAPSGAPANVTKCSQSPNGCYKTASATCRGSYQALDSESHAGGLLADALPGPVTWYAMTYQCGPSDGKVPAFPLKGEPPHMPPPAPVIVSGPQSPAFGLQAGPTTMPPAPAWSAQPPPPAPSMPRNTSCQTFGSSTNCTTQ